MQSFRSIGHSLPGFMLLGLPLCIAIAIAYHRVLKPALPAFMPSAGGMERFVREYAERPSPAYSSFTYAGWAMFVLSAFIGYLTHIFVDNWTHRYGFFCASSTFLAGESRSVRCLLFASAGFVVTGSCRSCTLANRQMDKVVHAG